MEEKVSDAAVDNIFSGFKRRINKAKKQYEDIPSGMKKDSKTRTEIQAKLANKALQDDKPFQEFKDTRREVFGTQRYGKGGKVKKKRTKKQLRASADDSYGKFGSKAKKSGKINR